MSSKPILFNTEMVKAILDGRKTQTRRLTFHQDKESMEYLLRVQKNKPNKVINGRYNKGDVLYVRETWCYGSVVGEDDEYGNSESWLEQLQGHEDNETIFYKADMEDAIKEGISFDEVVWKPSIHMPKKYARIFLKVTNVRVERLQDIFSIGYEKEGFDFSNYNTFTNIEDMKNWWIKLWNSTSKDGYKWEDNPYVFVYDFERVEKQ